MGLRNGLRPGSSVSSGHRRGDDGEEACLWQKDGAVFVLQGFADGHLQSTDHAGAPRVAEERAGRARSFAATVGADSRMGEWRIRSEAAGIDPARTTKVRFNVGVRKTAWPCPWAAWGGTGSANFLLSSAGEIVLPTPE